MNVPQQYTIAVDAMGGDHGPAVILPACLKALKIRNDINLIVVGNQEILEKELASHKALTHPRIKIQHASQTIAMDESPTQALRFKKDSSMRVAINLVKENLAQACVSAGNTGALMATAKFVLKTLPGVDRPAIIAVLPSTQQGRKVRMLDLGANVDTDVEHLVQFAVMGSVLVHAVDNIPEPTIGLLNIGTEEIKGNEQVKKASQRLTEMKGINYIGYVEGDEIFKGVADVVVCDGFVGNVALKVTEGVVKLLGFYIKQAFNRNWFTRLSALAALYVLKGLGKQVDPARYNGASLLGLQGIVIKSHGSANKNAFANAILEAAVEIKNDVPKRVGHEVETLLSSFFYE